MGNRQDENENRRTRRIDAKDTFEPENETRVMHTVFRKRLTYLMNGNNHMNKPVNIQELADAVHVSRPAIQKYLKPKKHKEPTTPSSLTICRIAEFFRTTPNFLLGFDGPVDDSLRLGFESDYYNRLGLNQVTIDKLCELRSMCADEAHRERAAALQSMLDKQIFSFAEDALKILRKENT